MVKLTLFTVSNVHEIVFFIIKFNLIKFVINNTNSFNNELNHYNIVKNVK